jgi:8-oxo-dGTP diphosphatase
VTNVKKGIKIAPKAIIFDQDRVLVLRRSKTERKEKNSHGWDFPGGGLEPGELVMEALAREVKEETGLHVKVISPAYIYDELIEEKHLIVMKFVCCQPVGQIVLSTEHEDYRWVEISNIANESYPDWMKEEIRRAYCVYQAFRGIENRVFT